jgi:hypothetical protein
MAQNPKKTQPETLTGASINQAISDIAVTVFDECPEVQVQAIGILYDLIQRGKQRTMAEWAADPDVSAERASLLSKLMATKDHEEGLEELALLTARSIRETGKPDAAVIAVSSFIASPRGFDLFRTKYENPDETVPEAFFNLFGRQRGASVRQPDDLVSHVRTKRLAALFGYAYSGLMAMEIEKGIINENGAELLGRSQALQYEIQIKATGRRMRGGSDQYEIVAREGAGGMSENTRSVYRPDVAFINDERKQIVIGFAFSGPHAERQRDELTKYLAPLLHATHLENSPWFGYTVAPFYMHAGTFVPGDAEIRNGHETGDCLIANGVPVEQQRALATLELMAVPMRAVAPEQVAAFFKCDPVVGGTSTVEHLRHVEQTADLPFEAAMEHHIAFLAKQATLAAHALAAIANGPEEIEWIISVALDNLRAFLSEPYMAFGGMSKSTFDMHWIPMAKTFKKLSDAVVKRHRHDGEMPMDYLLLDKWNDIHDAIERLLKTPYATMQKDHRETIRDTGSVAGVAGSVSIIRNFSSGAH